MNIMHKLTMIGLVALVFAAVSVPAAEAAEHWGALGSFGLAPGDPQPLSDPAGVAVNTSTGHASSGYVYVVDTGHDRVEWFDSAGKYEGQFNGSATPAEAFSEPEGIAVDSDSSSPSFGDVYVIDEGHSVVDKFSSSGAYLGQLTGVCEEANESTPLCSKSKFVPFITLDGVAVDTDGVVWVENGEEHHVHPSIANFSNGQPNVFIASRTSQANQSAQHGLAVDAKDNLYVVHRGVLDVAKLNSAGEVLGGEPGEMLGGEGALGIAVDPASNNLYVDLGSKVAVVSPAELLSESFGGGLLNNAVGVAVDPSVGASGYAYLVEPADNDVLILEHSETLQAPPSAPETNAATGVTGREAQLNGKLNEGGVGYSFSYIASPGTSCTEAGSMSTPLDNGATNPTSSSAVSATVTGLEPRREYVFCLVADGFGAMVGSQEAFTTSAASPEVISESGANINGESENAVFSATINSNHSKQETTYLFEYSTEGSPTGNTLGGTVKTVPGEGSIPAEEYGEQPVSSQPVTLSPVEATFYYRIVATNGTGTTRGKVQAYTKSPIVNDPGASDITPSSATLEAEVFPNFQQTKYGFEYFPTRLVLEEGDGRTISGASELEASAPTTHVSASANGLEEGIRYYYRGTAENASSENPNGATEGGPATSELARFITERLPFAETEHVESITRTSATLTGIVIPFDKRTTYYFRYISEARYQEAFAKGKLEPYAEGETTAPVLLAASSEPHHTGPVAATGLLPETMYRYRLYAENEWGISQGEDETFTTTGKILPEVTTGPASGVTQTAATISATVATNGLKTNYGFEIGTAPDEFGPVTGLGSISGATTEAVSEGLDELQPGTTYYYRVTATNVDGVVDGAEQAFTTAALPNLLTTPVAPPTLAAIPPFELPKEETQIVKKKPTKAQLLVKALKACKKDKSKGKRVRCEKAARAKYKKAPKKHGAKK